MGDIGIVTLIRKSLPKPWQCVPVDKTRQAERQGGDVLELPKTPKETRHDDTY